MPELLIGCPVRDRAWILPRWFDHVERACVRAEVDPSYIFVGDPSTDVATWDVINRRAGDRLALPIVVEEPPPTPGEPRSWNSDRYHHMVDLRNDLLAGVRYLGPRWFLSLDSDMLIHPDTIIALIDSLARFDAVGGKAYLTPGTLDHATYAILQNGTLYRPEFSGVVGVDAIMAIKLMSPMATSVDYRWHPQGEDIGWSIAARARGLRLGWNGTVVSKHVFSRDDLDRVDTRVGF